MSTMPMRFLAVALPIVLLSAGCGGNAPAEDPPLAGAAIGGPFELVDKTGKTVRWSDFDGKYRVVYFGYTYCPDVCPTTLAEATGWKQQLGLDDDQLRIVFVSVDPERDTLEHTQGYLTNFGPDVMGLVGDQAQTEQIKRSYGVFSEKTEVEGSTEYLMNHTASVFMIDDEGEFFGTIAYQEDNQTALDKVRRLTGA